MQKIHDFLEHCIAEIKLHTQSSSPAARQNGSPDSFLKAVLRDEVMPAWGCTEPSSVALAGCLAFSLARKQGAQISDIKRVSLSLSASVFKNSFGVGIPYTGGMKGLKIAAALGLLSQEPHLKLELLKNVTPDILQQAKKLASQDIIDVHLDGDSPNLKICVEIHTAQTSVRAIIEGNHTNLSEITVDGRQTEFSRELMRTLCSPDSPVMGHKRALRECSIAELLEYAAAADDTDQAYILGGVLMNLELAKAGFADPACAPLYDSLCGADGYAQRAALFASVASHARMNGIERPAMSSGGSGNQGILATLLPYLHGLQYKTETTLSAKSIALSHLVNSYVKCFLGELSPICGCAIGAGLGAAAAIIMQRCPPHDKPAQKAASAINNLIADQAGVLCDGAKTSCALKVGTAAYASAKAAELALRGYAVENRSGIIGDSAEQSIRNLGRVGREGMARSDRIVLTILEEASA